MSLVSAIVVYICIWSLMLFIVLPFDTTHGRDSPVRGQDLGAPDHRNFARTFIKTSVFSLLVFVIVYILFVSGVFDLYLSEQPFR